MAINPHEDKSTLIGIVVDRNDPNNLGGHKVFCPQIHGKDTKVEHLPWIRYQMPPGAHGASTNQGALDHGQMVVVKRDGGEAGSGFGMITGVLQTKRQSDPNMPGNVSLINAYKQISEALEKESPINVRPDIEEVFENGHKIRKVKEKGKKHKHSLLNGVMGHGAAYPMNATILPQLTNIGGAAQPNIGGISADILDMMPGINIGGLSDILNLIPPDVLDSILGSMPSGVVDQLLNTTAMTSSVSTIPVDGMMCGSKVDPLALAAALPDLLSGINTPGGLDYALSNITSNLSSLGSVGTSLISMPVSTPFGDIIQQVDPLTGDITSVIPDSVASAQQVFGGMMDSLPTAGGAGLFGDSSQLMSDMSQRLSDPAMTAKFKDKMEKNVSTTKGTDARKALNELGGSTNKAVQGAKSFFGG